jgi:hypothetical protein
VKIEGASLRKTLVLIEKRLVKKFDDTSQSLKDYVDIRISLVRDDMQQNTLNIRHSIKQLEKRLDTNTTGLLDLIERRTGEIISLY